MFDTNHLNSLEFAVSRKARRRAFRQHARKRYLVGPVLGADGTFPASGRQGKTGEACVAQTHGKYYEAASRGNLFFASDQGAGIAVTSTNTAPGTTAMFSLYNPVNSGLRISIKRVRVGYVSGTLSPGCLMHCLSAQLAAAAMVAPTGGTLLVVYSCAAGQITTKTVQGVPRTVSTVVAPFVVGPICSFGTFAAATATPLHLANEDVDGELCVEPGFSYQIQPIVPGAGTSPKLSLGVTWEEIPYVTGAG